MIDQQGPPKMETKLYKIDQQWLDEHVYSEAADLEPELNKLAEGAGRLADCEHRLIEAIKLKKHQLERLPEIIRRLEAQRRGVSHDLADVLSRHDQLDTAHKLLTAQQQQPADGGGMSHDYPDSSGPPPTL